MCAARTVFDRSLSASCLVYVYGWTPIRRARRQPAAQDERYVVGAAATSPNIVRLTPGSPVPLYLLPSLILM